MPLPTVEQVFERAGDVPIRCHFAGAKNAVCGVRLRRCASRSDAQTTNPALVCVEAEVGGMPCVVDARPAGQAGFPRVARARPEGAAEHPAKMRVAHEAVLMCDLRNAAAVARVGEDRMDAIETSLLDEGGDAAQRLAQRIERGARQPERLADALRREIGRAQMAIDVTANLREPREPERRGGARDGARHAAIRFKVAPATWPASAACIRGRLRTSETRWLRSNVPMAPCRTRPCMSNGGSTSSSASRGRMTLMFSMSVTLAVDVRAMSSTVTLPHPASTVRSSTSPVQRPCRCRRTM